MDFLTALIFGIVEGITEFLPVSSTGHLMLTSSLLGFKQDDFLKSFEIAIQFGAILSVVALYWKSFLARPEVLKRIGVAFLPTALVGFAMYPVIKNVFLASERIVVFALFFGGLFLIIFELVHKEKPSATEDIAAVPYKTAALIGLFQSVAVIPGVSRSAATIVGGLALGLRRKTIVDFSFLLAVPTMLAATGFDLFKNASAFSFDQFEFLAVGFIASFFFAALSIKFLLRFIKTHTFLPFGIYRVVVAIVFWLVMFM